MGETPVKAGASISCSLHTENTGIEKIIDNVISNPNIRSLVGCVQKSNDTLLDTLSKLYMKMG